MTNDLRTLLLAQATITSLVGQRIFVDSLPQVMGQDGLLVQNLDLYPCILVAQTNHDPLKTLDGTSGLRYSDVDVDAMALGPGAAEQIRAAVRTFFKDFSGSMGTLACKSVLLNDEQDETVEPQHADDQRIFIRNLDFGIFFE